MWEWRETKKTWGQLIYYKARGMKLPKGKKRVNLHYIFPSSHRRDPDNYSGKMILDGLVQAGVLEDDSFKNIELVLTADFQKGIRKTIISIEEIKGD